MSVIVFDVELAGQDEDGHALEAVIVHHDSFENTAFPLTHILNVAADELGWPRPWIELRCQNTGDVLALIQYEKNSQGRWCNLGLDGKIPEKNSRVDLYLLDHKPNRSLDAFLEVDV